MDNILFLNSVKKAYLLSLVFDDLADISKKIEQLFNVDISHIDEEYIKRLNELYITVHLMHILIMKEIYRSKLLKHALVIRKTASIAGPWSQLDLPMEERVFPYDEGSEHEEYMQNRTRAKQNQMRYAPEYSQVFGIYYSWEDLRRSPYPFFY